MPAELAVDDMTLGVLKCAEAQRCWSPFAVLIGFLRVMTAHRDTEMP